VSSDYLAYQTYDSLQAFFSTITSLLANRAILQGLGVGDANTTATYALLLTILKDGISRVATIMFAYRFGLTIEPECKKYRFLADIFNDSAFFLDLFSPYFDPWAKLFSLTAAEALRAMCGVAAGASKAALSSHFAKQNNLAELNAKEASQETAVGLIGLAVGSFVVRYVEGRETVLYLMIVLVFVHLWMNYLGVRCVKLEHLNRQRATIIMQHFLETRNLLTPEQAAERERIILWTPHLRNRQGEYVGKVVFARSYGDAVGFGARSIDISCGFDGREAHGFQIYVWRQPKSTTLKILLFENGHPSVATEACICAIELAWNMRAGCSGGLTPCDEGDEKVDGLYEAMTSQFFGAISEWDTRAEQSSLETAVPFKIRPERPGAVGEVKKDL
jgi:hypothetical protein